MNACAAEKHERLVSIFSFTLRSIKSNKITLCDVELPKRPGAPLLLYYALWLVTKIGATFPPNQMQTKTNHKSRRGHPRFPALKLVDYFHFEFSLVPCDIFFVLIGNCGKIEFGFTTYSKRISFNRLVVVAALVYSRHRSMASAEFLSPRGLTMS